MGNLLLDASSPIIAYNSGASTAVASFTPPAGSRIVVASALNTTTNNSPAVPGITDNLGVHLTYQLLHHSILTDGPAAEGQCAVWTTVNPTATAMTITVTNADASTGQSLKVWVWTDNGGGTPTIGATKENGKSGASTSITDSVTATATGSRGVIVYTDWSAVTPAPTAGTGCTLTGGGAANQGVVITYAYALRTTADGVSGNAITMNLSTTNTANNRWIIAEVVPAAGGGSGIADVSPQWTPGFMLNVPRLPWLRHVQLPYDINASGAQVYQQALTADIGFTGSDNQLVGSRQTAQLSFTGSDAQRVAKTLAAAALSFTGSDAMLTAKTLAAAALSFTGSLATQAVHNFTQALNATLSFTGVQSRAVRTALVATLAFVGALPRRTSDIETGTVGFTGNTTKRTARTLPATLSFTGALTRRTAHLFTATLSFTGSLASAAVHLFTQALSASVGFTASLAPAAVHFFTQALAATVGFTGTTRVTVRKTTTATLSFAGALLRRPARALTATLSFTGAQTRRVSSLKAATLTTTGTLTRRISRLLAAATLAFTGTLITQAVHFYTQALAATLSFTGSLTIRRGYARLLAATVGFTGAITRRVVGKLNAATLSFTTTMPRRMTTRLAAALSFTVSFTRLPTLTSALSELRTRIFGREPGNASGREPPRGFMRRESGGASGREPPRSVGYERNDGPIAGEEDGT